MTQDIRVHHKSDAKLLLLRGLGRLWSIQGLPSTMPHGMVETLHGADFSFLSGKLRLIIYWLLQATLMSGNKPSTSTWWVPCGSRRKLFFSFCKMSKPRHLLVASGDPDEWEQNIYISQTRQGETRDIRHNGASQ